MATLKGTTWAHTRGFAPMAATAQVYQDARPDVEITWERRSLWSFGEQTLDELAKGYDLLVIDHPMMGDAAESGSLVRLDEYVGPDAMSELAALSVGRSHSTYLYQGHQYGLAIDAACQVASSRPDLLAAAGEPVPATWDAVLGLARRTGRVAMSFTPIDCWSALLSLSANLGAPCGTRPGTLLPDHGVAAHALGLLRELARLVDPRCRRLNPIGILNWMSQTDDVLYCPLAYGYANYSRTGYASRLLDAHDMPAAGESGSVGSCLGGAGIAVSAHSADIDAAVAYAVWVAGPQLQATEYVRAGGQPAISSAWDSDEVNAMTRDFFRNTRATIDGSYLRPNYPGFPDFQTEAAELLQAAVYDDGPVEPVLAALEEQHAASFR